MRRAAAPAKINLSLAVGPVRGDGLHELTSVFQRIDIADRVAVEGESDPRHAELTVEGFAEDTLVRRALDALVAASGYRGSLRATIEKHIPVAAGLGGGSADAGVVLGLANEILGAPLSKQELVALAFELGADVPFFLSLGPQLVEGAGERMRPLELAQDYWVVVALPRGVEKPSTAEIYRRFDAAAGQIGYAERRAALLDSLDGSTRARDLAALPGNDLAPFTGSEGLALELSGLGAFRADVSGAGPAVYGLFLHERHAREAIGRLENAQESWLTVPVW